MNQGGLGAGERAKSNARTREREGKWEVWWLGEEQVGWRSTAGRKELRAGGAGGGCYRDCEGHYDGHCRVKAALHVDHPVGKVLRQPALHNRVSAREMNLVP